jgi:DNA repair exonuclease SbcCD nuclease subunit
LIIVDNPMHFFFEEDNSLLITIPYLYRQKLNLASNHQVVQHYKEALDRSIAAHPNAETKVLIGHQTAEGASLLECKDINSFNEIIVPKEMLEKLDAAFFGHIHKYQVLNEASPLIVNHGSPVTLTFGEVEEKGFAVYDTKLKRHKRVLIASTPFVKIKIDSSQSDFDATTLIVKELTKRQAELAGSIVKIFATIKEEDLPLRAAEVKTLLQDVQFYAGIEKTIIRKERARSKEVTKFASPDAILVAVAKAKKLSAEDTEAYLRTGMEIVAKVTTDLGSDKQ